MASDIGTIEAEVDAWLTANWDADLTVGEWWKLLADSGYAAPALPEAAGGRSYGRSETQAVRTKMAAHGAMGPPTGLGMMLAAPTIAAHGSPELIADFVAKILDGTQAWCQLFSEPNAGSDLAGLQTKAERDGDEWIINGQKVWTSGGQIADMGMLIARTDPDAPKHSGITYFGIPMDQEGIDVRPLTEMTGRAMFNEVFLDDARVANDAMIGELGEGWRVANTTLLVERTSLGSSMVPLPSVNPGQVAGNLERRVGDCFSNANAGEDGIPGAGPTLTRKLIEIAQEMGSNTDPVVRDRLARLWSMIEINRLSALRAKAGNASPGYPNLAKLNMSDLYRESREVGCLILGAEAMLAPSDAIHGGGAIQEITMFSPGPSIYGGTDQVQRNIIGERVLGLPKEPGPDKSTPFSELAKN